jgi:hypothetical protein
VYSRPRPNSCTCMGPVTPNETRSSAHPGLCLCEVPDSANRHRMAGPAFNCPRTAPHTARHWHPMAVARVVVVLGDSSVICQSAHQHHRPVTHKKNLWRGRREGRKAGPSWTESPPPFGLCRETTITQHILPSPPEKLSKQPIKPQKQTSMWSRQHIKYHPAPLSSLV